MPVLDTEISSPSTCDGTSVRAIAPVAGSSVTSAPFAVTATIAGGVTAAPPPRADTDADAPVVTVTVAAGDGGPLVPQADNTVAADTAARPRKALPVSQPKPRRGRQQACTHRTSRAGNRALLFEAVEDILSCRIGSRAVSAGRDIAGVLS